jgi:hypothetical protein
MKRLLLIAAALFVAGPVAAQEQDFFDRGAELPGIDSLAARLKLTERQRTELSALRDSFRTDSQKERRDFGAAASALKKGRQTGVPADSLGRLRASARTNGQALRNKAEGWGGKMRAKLTAEQQAEWDKWMQERRVKMREEVRQRQGGGGRGPGGAKK